MSNIEREPTEIEGDPDANKDKMILQQFNKEFEKFLSEKPEELGDEQEDELSPPEIPEKKGENPGIRDWEIPRSV